MDQLKHHIYHYTGATAILSIVTGRNLWLSDSFYVNDRSEGRLIDEYIKHIISGQWPFELPGGVKLTDRHREVLSCEVEKRARMAIMSFSGSPHMLTQFRMYCPIDGGYVIGFPSEFLDKVSERVKCNYIRKDGFGWAKNFVVEYIRNLDRIDNGTTSPHQLAIDNCRGNNLFNKRMIAGITYKAEEFLAEDETRLYVQKNNLDMKYQFRASRNDNAVIPYLELKLPNEEIDVYIGYGPNTNSEQARHTISSFMMAARKAGTKWKFSYSLPEFKYLPR